jgi:hypothetical protein
MLPENLLALYRGWHGITSFVFHLISFLVVGLFWTYSNYIFIFVAKPV